MTAVELARVIEALLFLSSEPVPASELIEATEASELEVRAALDLLTEDLAPGRRGVELKELAGVWGVPICAIGEFFEGEPMGRLRDETGDRPMPAGGHDHFLANGLEGQTE